MSLCLLIYTPVIWLWVWDGVLNWYISFEHCIPLSLTLLSSKQNAWSFFLANHYGPAVVFKIWSVFNVYCFRKIHLLMYLLYSKEALMHLWSEVSGPKFWYIVGLLSLLQYCWGGILIYPGNRYIQYNLKALWHWNMIIIA